MVKKNGRTPYRKFGELKSWVKPTADPFARVVAKALRESDGFETIADVSYMTTLGHSTISGVLTGKTRRPQAVTLEMILRYAGKELAVKDAKRK